MNYVKAIGEFSPKSHICIHSGETGPGKFTDLPFISLWAERFEVKIRKFVATVEKRPYRTTAAKIDLSVLARPTAVLTGWGVVKVFPVVEGQQLPTEAQRLIEGGGRVLSIPEAIERIGSISSMASRAAIYREQQRTEQIGIRPSRPRRRLRR